MAFYFHRAPEILNNFGNDVQFPPKVFAGANPKPPLQFPELQWWACHMLPVITHLPVVPILISRPPGIWRPNTQTQLWARCCENTFLMILIIPACFRRRWWPRTWGAACSSVQRAGLKCTGWPSKGKRWGTSTEILHGTSQCVHLCLKFQTVT